MVDYAKYPGWIPPPPAVVNGNLSPNKINQLSTKQATKQATVAAANSPHRLIYGRERVGGRIFAFGQIGSDWVFGYEWCLGEIEEVESIWLNDEAPPGTVQVTHYTGTLTQGVDPWLAAAIAGYNDDLIDRTISTQPIGIAYTVIRFPTTVEGFPRLQGVIKGKKVYDPRTGLTEYTENPALCCGDLVTSTLYGMGREVLGLEEAADNCDFLVQGVDPRCRIGIAFSTPRRTAEYVDLLAEYSEMFWVEDSGKIRFITDTPVETPSCRFTLTGDGDNTYAYVKGSIVIQASDLGESPTAIEVTYVDTTGGAEPWQENIAPYELPGVSDGLVPRIPTTIKLEGIHRYSEAYRKAIRRLRRTQIPNAIRLETFDPGIIHQVGDVVEIDIPERNINLWARITSVSMSSMGRYSVSASEYSDELYPDDVISPTNPSPLPNGLLAFWASGDLPPDWTEYIAFNGRALYGETVARPAGTLFGGGVTTLTGNTSSDGGHSHLGTNGPIFALTSGTTPNQSQGLFSAEDAHSHSYQVAVGEMPMRTFIRLVQKTSGTFETIPPGMRVLAVGNIYNPAIQRINITEGSYLAVGATNGVIGDNTKSSFGTVFAAGAHNHGLQSLAGTQVLDFTQLVGELQGVPNHQHTFTSTTLTYSAPDVVCGMYGSSSEFRVVAGMIFPYVGDLGDLPADWQVCDGTNGTPDLRGKWLRLSNVNAEPSTALQSQIQFTAFMSSHTHTHNTTGVGRTRKAAFAGHAPHTHSHVINQTHNWEPASVAIKFVAYVPSV